MSALPLAPPKNSGCRILEAYLEDDDESRVPLLVSLYVGQVERRVERPSAFWPADDEFRVFVVEIQEGRCSAGFLLSGDIGMEFEACDAGYGYGGVVGRSGRHGGGRIEKGKEDCDGVEEHCYDILSRGLDLGIAGMYVYV